MIALFLVLFIVSAMVSAVDVDTLRGERVFVALFRLVAFNVECGLAGCVAERNAFWLLLGVYARHPNPNISVSS